MLTTNRLSNSSAGWDNFRPEIVKSVSHVINEPLTYIINLSFEQGIIPNELKLANVVPIHKTGDVSKFCNYRPISVLPVFSKILEKLMYSRLYAFLTKYDILNNSQFGFRRGLSTELALSIFLDKITHALDKGDHVIGLFVDFAKAFDTVDHGILLDKLSFYGIRGLSFTWFSNYLSNRKQRVTYNRTNSDIRDIVCGVPQGSILGPLLFLLYINDLSTVSKEFFTIMYADDTNLFLQGSDISEVESTFNTEISKVTDWIKANKLSINVKKTHSMIFSCTSSVRNKIVNVSIDNVCVDTVSCTRFLGVLLDNRLSWDQQIQHVCNKISKCTGVMKKASRVLLRDTLLQSYYTFVYPYNVYCNIIW